MSEVKCVKIRLRPKSLPRVRTWAATMQQRREEALATLVAEGTLVESVFLGHDQEGDYLIYYMRAENLARAAAIGARLTDVIQGEHEAFKRDAWETSDGLELLVDLELPT